MKKAVGAVAGEVKTDAAGFGKCHLIPTSHDKQTAIARSGATKQSSWIDTARFAHLAMANVQSIADTGIRSFGGRCSGTASYRQAPRNDTSKSQPSLPDA
jgi:hypothetical protein